MNRDKIQSLNDPIYADLLIEELEARIALEQLEERLELAQATPDCWDCTLCFFN